MSFAILAAVLLGLVLTFVLILWVRLPAFIALLLASIATGLAAGSSPTEVIEVIKRGMGNTLGTIATIVGLGAMFAAMLEKAGGAQAIAKFTLDLFGKKRASTAMVFCGFLVAIPVFFDVGFIILIPVIYALQREMPKTSLLLYAIPLLAGLAVTHAFIPPTPGPIAVAELINADLGWVMLAGAIAGIPTAIISGPVFAHFIAKKIFVAAPDEIVTTDARLEPAPIGLILFIIGVPILLILGGTFVNSGILETGAARFDAGIEATFGLIGHPFGALLIANLLAWYLLGVRRGESRQDLFEITSKSLAPAGTIILLTGAGGVFKEMLTATGGGKNLAELLLQIGLPPIFFAYFAAVLVRVVQGSATVAMMAGAGLVAPVIAGMELTEFQLATMVIAIASGASICSHVNDSGFWLVSQYLCLDEKQTLMSWTLMTTILSLVGFAMSLLMWYLI